MVKSKLSVAIKPRLEDSNSLSPEMSKLLTDLSEDISGLFKLACFDIDKFGEVSF